MGERTLTPDIIIDSLKSNENEMKSERNEIESEEIRLIRDGSQNTGEEGQNCGDKKKCRDRSQEKAKGNKCYECRKIRHFISDCFKEKKQTEEKKSEIDKCSDL
ncbi:hypothetical protein Adt_27710 [Abeliophyllum distichum]|uniref:CCHC-type domain-containing protein n=1 Tax=Abeliophyllum distichum TaxID=126358 RepID=A0ABD1RWL0_9LAMI